MKTAPDNEAASTNPPLERNPAILEFIRRISRIEGVRCVVAEPEDGAIHLTTFATPLGEEIEEAIFTVEAATIDDFPDFLFDFHLSDAADYAGGTIESIPGECFVWGSLNAEPRRTPQTSE